MRFSHLIHPEIVLDTRGNLDTRAYYRDILKHVYPRGEGKGVYGLYEKGKVLEPKDDYIPAFTFNSQLINSVNGDINMIDHWSLCRKFAIERPPVFHLSRDFAQALESIDKEIPIDILPERFFCYLSFPEKTIRDDTSWVQGAYVYIGPGYETTARPELQNEKVLWVSYMGYPAPGTWGHDVTRICIDVRPKTVSKLMESVKTVDVPENVPNREQLDPVKRNAVLRTIVNALIYIHSQDPAIDLLRPTRNLSKGSKQALIASGGHLNDCTLPVQLLNWSYQKPRERHVDETIVRAHPRWQRCGPQLSQVKWILIEEHVRRFKD